METLEKFFKKLLIALVGVFHSAKRIAVTNLPLSRFKRILVVKQHDQLGDLLVTTPALRALRKRFPHSHISIVVREYTAPMIWENPHVDSVIVFYEKLNRWTLNNVRFFWEQLRGDDGFDCAIVMNSVSRSLSSDIIAVLSKAKYIIGPNHLSLDPNSQEKIYNVLTQRSRKVQHESEHYLDIVRALDAHADGLDYDLVLTEEEESEAEKVLYNVGVQSGAVKIGVHFGALNKEKRFPLDKLAKVIEWIKAHYTCEVLLIIGPHEVQLRQELLSRIRNTEVRSIPLLPIRISSAVIKKLHLLLCNDTATMHIASALRVPTISFHSISDPAQWKPPHERHIGLRANDNKITSISVEMVTSAVETQMMKLGFHKKEG
ncbi:MAG: glycosyltransferase family 9 protein [Bacteroidota bacterium]